MNIIFKGLNVYAVMILVASLFCGVTIQAEPLTGKTAVEITKLMGTGWNLGNSLDATNGSGLSSETSWGNPKTTQAMIDTVKAAGFNTVRIPVSWGKHTSNNGTYTYKIDDQWMARVKEVVDYCFNNDMFVILNIHHDNTTDYMYPSTTYKDNSITFVKDIWTQVAAVFADYDQHLIFEILNEPRLVGNTNEWWFTVNSPQADVKDAIDIINTLNQTGVDAIRNSNGSYNVERMIMCPGYCASLDGCTTPAFKLPTDNADNRIAVSVHAYTPYSLCLEAPGSSTFSESMKADINYTYNTLKSNFTSKNIAVVIGETSASNKNNLESRLKWVEAFYGCSKSYGIPCVLWDNNQNVNTQNIGECHGYLDRSGSGSWFEYSIIEKIMSTLGISPNTGLDDALSSVHFSIYPNPVSETLFIKSDLGLIGLEVFDSNGRLRNKILCEGQTATYNVTELEPGLYIIRVITKDGSYIHHSIIK